MAKILVVAEQQAGQLKKSTLAAITLARQIGAKVGGGFDLLVVGKGLDGVVDALQGYGAETILKVDGAAFDNYLAEPYTAAVNAALGASKADFVLAPSGTFGKDLLPRVAAAIGAGMVADCMALADAPGLAYKRPMYAGNVIATVKVNTPKVVITVRVAEFDAAGKTGGSSAVSALSVDGAVGGARFVGYSMTESERPELTEADIVVSGGRGLKDGPTFWSVMNPLADSFGAAIGATRAVVDSWPEVPNDMQVGQTGKVVAPKLYLAVAMSGAIQHLAGMKNSKTIVAINKDGDAPIFQVADYGLVGDAFKLVPELTEKVKAAKA
jgi:electron transfer flavoprotein alpha subunit